MKKWKCIVCGFIYDEEGVAAGGACWDDILADWECPDCGVSKEDFEMMEISIL